MTDLPAPLVPAEPEPTLLDPCTCLRDDEVIVKGRRYGRTTWRVVGATRWTA